jgi:hypothetical protein
MDAASQGREAGRHDCEAFGDAQGGFAFVGFSDEPQARKWGVIYRKNYPLLAVFYRCKDGEQPIERVEALAGRERAAALAVGPQLGKIPRGRGGSGAGVVAPTGEADR